MNLDRHNNGNILLLQELLLSVCSDMFPIPWGRTNGWLLGKPALNIFIEGVRILRLEYRNDQVQAAFDCNCEPGHESGARR